MLTEPRTSPSNGGAARERDARTSLLAALVESCSDAILATTTEGVITSWNRGAEVIYGHAAAECIGRNVSAVIQPDRPHEMEGNLARIRSGERVDHHDTVHVRRDASTIWVSLTVSPVHDAQGGLAGASCIARDITERKRADERRLAASHYVRSLIEASLDPLVTISPEGKITDVNEATIKVTGVDREALIGTDFCDYFTTPEKAREGYHRVFSKGSVTDYPLTIRDTEGRLTDVLYNASLYKNANGEVLGVFAAARDVSKQKEASQYARSLIEASADPLVTISASGKITDVNAATIKVTGILRDKLIGTDFSDYFTEPEKAREGYRQVFAKQFVTDYPLTIRHRDGSRTDVLYNASVYKDVQGNVLGVFAAARDVTAQRRVEGELAEQRTKDLERLAELERFQKVTVGRELKMIELKKEIEELKRAVQAGGRTA